MYCFLYTSGLHPLEYGRYYVSYCEYDGKLTLAELTDDKWLDEEPFLVAGSVCRDKAAAANLEEEEEEEGRPVLRGHRWLTGNIISRL